MTKTLYTDAGYDYHKTDLVEEGEQILGRICVTDNEGFSRIEIAGVDKVPVLRQYINVFELIAIARSIQLAIEKGWVGSLAIHSDSEVAIIWAQNGVNKKIETKAHTDAYEYLRTARRNYIGVVTYSHVRRDSNPAGKLLEIELEKDKVKKYEARKEEINTGSISFVANCDCGCHKGDESNGEIVENGCDICVTLHNS